MNNIKKRLLSMLLTAVMLCGLCVPTAFAAESRYSDTKGHWAEKSIDRWSGYEIIGGYGGGLFGPDDTLTRAQMAVILARLLALPDAESAGFTDVAEDAWYADGINRCYAAGIMVGYDGKAMPDDPISREQAMVMICHALGFEAKADADLSAYTDAGEISSYAVGCVAAMVKNGIVSGTSKTTLSPTANITRGAVVTILDRGIAVYANEDNATVDAKGTDGLILIVADKVTVKNAPKGTSVLVSKGAVGTKVNGKTVAAGTVYTATEQRKPSSGGGGYTPSNLTVSAAGTVPSGTYRNVTIASSVGNDDVTLDGVTIIGDLIVQGGGSNSIKLKNCGVSGKVILDKTLTETITQLPRLELTNTSIAKIEAVQAAIIEAVDSTSPITAVEAKANVTVKGVTTKVEAVTVPASATSVNLTVDGAKVNTVAAEAPVTIDANNNASPIQKVEAKNDVTLKGDAVQVHTIEIPATAENKPVIDVQAGTVAKVEAKSETTITGAANSVNSVVAEAPVSVESAAVDKVEVPATAPADITVSVTGDAAVEVAVNSTNGAAITGSNVTVSTELETAPDNITVGGVAVEHIHKWVEDTTKYQPATCAAAGQRTYACNAEGACTAENAAKIETIPALAHTEVIDFAVAPTCEDTGLTAGKHCSVCNTVLMAQETVPAKGHAYGDAAYTWAKNEDGYTCTADRVCANDKTHVDQATAEVTSEVTKAATCTEKGEMTYTAVFNKESFAQQTKTEEIPALGHDFSVAQHDDSQHWMKCSRCDATDTKTNHSYAVNSCDVAAKCQGCDYEKPAGNHSYGNYSQTTAPTCTEKGSEKATCSVCGHEITREVPALGHKEVVDKAKEPTCTETGLTEGKHCSVCNEVLVKQETVPVKQHTWDGGKVTTKPTTTTEGVKTYTCIVCETTRTETIPVITDEETTLLISIEKAPAGDNYITLVNGEPLYEITYHFENTVTVSFADLPDVPEDTWLPNYDLRFVDCVFEENLYVDYTDNYLQLWFDRCTFKNGAKLIMKGDGSKFNDLMFDVIYDKASYIDGSHCSIWFNPAAAGRETNYLICANRGQSIAVTGEQNATFCVGGMVDLSGLTVTSEKRIAMDAYLTGSELCTINLGNNKAEAVTPGVYFITAAEGNTNPVTIASDVDRDQVGLCVNRNWQQLAATSFLYNIRLEVENGLGWLRWDLIRGKDAMDDAGNPRELHYIVYAKTGVKTYEYEATEGGRLLTFPAGTYDYFEVFPYYMNGEEKTWLPGNSTGITVQAESGEVYEDKADATFTLPDTGNPFIEPNDYVVTLSGLSGYDAYLLYVDYDYFNGKNLGRSEQCGIVTKDTTDTAIPVSAVNYYDSTYTIYGIKDYRLIDGVLSYTIDCLRPSTNVPKTAPDVSDQ